MSTASSGSWTRFGIRVIERISDVKMDETDPKISVKGVTQPLVRLGCCNLAKPSDASCINRCTGSYHWKSWGCCQGGQFYSCGECTTGGNCNTGPFKCSYGTRVPGGCA